MDPRSLPLLLALALPAAWPAGARTPPPPLCPAGRYLVDGAALVPGSPLAPDVLVLGEDGSVSIASGCPAAAAKPKATRKGTKLKAKWAEGACPGLAGKPRLKGRIEPTCQTLTAKLEGKGLKRKLVARLSRCGDSVDDPPEPCPLLEGPADEPALDHVHDVFVAEGVPEAEIGDHPELGRVARTQLEIGFHPDATVAEVNAALEGAGASILAALEDVLWIVVRIPDPGSVPALEALAAQIDAEPGIAAVVLAGFPEADGLPANYLPPVSGALANIDHHLAVRGSAAWNAQSVLSPAAPPVVVVSDHFGGGAPAPPDFDLFTTAADYGAGNPNAHGYHVLGIIAGGFGGDGSNAGLVTGALPGTVFVRGADWVDAAGRVMSTAQDENLLLQRVRAMQPPPVVANTSWTGLSCRHPIFGPAQCPVAVAQAAALRWIQKVRGNIGVEAGTGLEEKFLHVTAAGNVSPGLPADTDSRLGTQFVAAALLPGITAGPFGLFDVPNLTNVVAVENVLNAPAAPFAPLCLSARSKRPGNLAAIGTGVWSMTAASGTAGNLNGTSMATPQVAGFAAYLWALRPTLSVLQLKTILQQTPQPSAPASGAAGCDPGAASAPVLDAYAAVLGADVPGNAPVRSAILDVADDTGAEGANGAFDEHDVERFLDAFAESFGSQDWSRHDLNGDGTTGDDDTDPAATARIDLDMDDPPAFETVEQTLTGDVVVSFDEAAVSDRDVLCYYAWSPLYTGDPDARDQLLERACCAEVEYALTELILAGDGEAWAWAINDEGVVAGASVGPGPAYDTRSFMWTPQPGSSTEGQYTVLEGESSGSRLDINDAGHVVGRSPPALDYPVVWEGGVPQAVPGVDFGEARAINDAGDLVGIGAGGNAWHASAGTVTPITLPWPRPPVTLPVGQGVHAISNTGAIVGVRDFPPSVYGRPAFWSSASAAPVNLGTVVAGGGTGEAFDVSDAGWVVGESRGPANATYIFGRRLPFVWGRDGNGMEQLPATAGLGPWGSASGVNERGEIVGKLSQDGVAPYERAVLWTGETAIDLNTLLSPGTQFVLSAAYDINERGQIVGEGHRLPYASDYTGHRGFVLTPRCAE